MVHAHHRSLHGAAVLVPCIVAIPLGTRCVDAQERANDGFVSLSQTVGDVTVRITAVKWCRKQDLGKRLGSGDDPRDKGLAIWYEVESDHPALEGAPGKKLTDHLTKITTLSELGRPLAQEWHKDRQYVWWRGVDPRWKTAIVQFELFDPRAPPEATGEFNDPLEFKGIPIPEAQASIIEVNHTLRTPRGTPVTLEKVGLRTKRHKEILFVIRWLPPE